MDLCMLHIFYTKLGSFQLVQGHGIVRMVNGHSLFVIYFYCTPLMTCARVMCYCAYGIGPTICSSWFDVSFCLFTGTLCNGFSSLCNCCDVIAFVFHVIVALTYPRLIHLSIKSLNLWGLRQDGPIKIIRLVKQRNTLLEGKKGEEEQTKQLGRL